MSKVLKAGVAHHILGIKEVLAEVRKLKEEILQSVQDKMMLSEEKFGARIVRIETAADADRLDLREFKHKYETGHMDLIKGMEAIGKQNADEHRGIMAHLNGLTKGQEDLYKLTSSTRATIRAEDAWRAYKTETRTGRFISSKFGKAVLVAVGTFAFFSVLHSLGVREVDPIGWVRALIGGLFPGAINK